MLQEIVNEDYYSLHDFLLYSTEEDRKRIESELVDRDRDQYYKYLDSLEFENKDELEAEVCRYIEHTNQSQLGMGEMGDVSEMADDYIEHRGLPFNDEDEED